MQAIELITTYPKVTEIIRSYFIDKLLESLKTEEGEKLPEEYKEYLRLQKYDDELLSQMVNASPRNLFDIFDEYNIYVQIIVELGEDATFTYDLLPRDTEIKDDGLDYVYYSTRKECETIAIQDCFQTLNEKLSTSNESN